jgi:hypothetical protein
MASNTFPETWRDEPCFLVSIPKSLAPFVGGLMRIVEQRGFWATEADYERGYAAVIEFEGCLVTTCLNVLLEQNDALYRMVNTALFGVEYATESTDPLVVTPPIAPHVTLDVHHQDSLLGRMDRLTQLLDNRIAGTETPLYDDLPGLKQQLQTIIDTMAADDTDIEGILEAAQAIVLLLG